MGDEEFWIAVKIVGIWLMIVFLILNRVGELKKRGQHEDDD